MPETTEVVSVKRVNAFIGAAFLMLGAAMACAIFAERWANLKLDFPAIWYRSRNFHLALCVLLFVLAWLSLRNASDTSTYADSAEPLFDTVVLYSRPSCKLCEEAFNVLVEFADDLPEVSTINIDNDSSLAEQFGECVPVVAIDGRVMFKGRVNRQLLQRLIRARRRQQLVIAKQAKHSDLANGEGQGK